mmetsp:Transcript_5467/g.8357  ORF Transcript_5467/g.8357 Transcript_5467/m.8357 type:complete len:103 (-) Transcript_5467:738-1046(-)
MSLRSRITLVPILEGDFDLPRLLLRERRPIVAIAEPKRFFPLPPPVERKLFEVVFDELAPLLELNERGLSMASLVPERPRDFDRLDERASLISMAMRARVSC